MAVGLEARGPSHLDQLMVVPIVPKYPVESGNPYPEATCSQCGTHYATPGDGPLRCARCRAWLDALSGEALLGAVDLNTASQAWLLVVAGREPLS